MLNFLAFLIQGKTEAPRQGNRQLPLQTSIWSIHISDVWKKQEADPLVAVFSLSAFVLSNPVLAQSSPPPCSDAKPTAN